MPKIILTTEQKTVIVTELACYTPPSKIQKILRERWKLEVGASTIVYYDPDTKGTEVAKKWIEMFRRTRDDYIARCARAPISRQEYRVQRLQDILDKEDARENTPGMRDTLKQAAEEVGGSYTNKRELTGQDGAPLVPTELVVRFVRPEPKTEARPEKPADGNGG